MSPIFDKTVKALIARIYYKKNYLKPNSDPSTLQMPVEIYENWFKKKFHFSDIHWSMNAVDYGPH